MLFKVSFIFTIIFLLNTIIIATEGNHLDNDNKYTEIIVDNPNGGIDRYYTFVSIDVFKKGLISEAIIGLNKNSKDNGEKINVEDFVENSVFKKLLHKVIQEYVPLENSFRNELKRQKNGWIYVMDKRDKNFNSESNNIIGGFKIENNKIIKYVPNKRHKLFTEKGFFILDDPIEKKLIEVILSYYK